MPVLVKGSIVRAPFEFAEGTGQKLRPVCVVSVEALNETGDLLVAMITSRGSRISAPGFGDVVLQDWQQEGLLRPSVLRTGRLLARTADLLSESRGRLSDRDQVTVNSALRDVLGLKQDQ